MISFTSNINFVSPAEYKKVKEAEASQVFLSTSEVYPLSGNSHTHCVRSCTAVFCTDANNKLKASHILDNADDKNLSKIKRDFSKNKIDKGIIIGAKDNILRPRSIIIFDKIQKFLEKKSDNISVFKNQINFQQESNIHYSPDVDTYTIVTRWKDDQHISSPKDLKSAFKNISIAPLDTLYINGKEITKEKHPEFFK